MFFNLFKTEKKPTLQQNIEAKVKNIEALIKKVDKKTEQAFEFKARLKMATLNYGGFELWDVLTAIESQIIEEGIKDFFLPPHP